MTRAGRFTLLLLAAVGGAACGSHASTSPDGGAGGGRGGAGGGLADGSAGWTFAFGGVDTSADSVAARGNTFVVAGANQITGSEDGAGDFDPGAGTQILFGNIRYLSRFTF